MEIKDQLVSYDLAKEMKELGFEQESLFWWVAGVIYPTNRLDWHLENDKEYAKRWRKFMPAYSVAELGEMLPCIISLEEMDGNYYLSSEKNEDCWEVSYDNETKLLHLEIAKTEADARAKIAIYLRKQGII